MAGVAARAPRPEFAVAVSGGRDSLALLHASCRAARAQGLGVVALHVNHGLLPDADAWESGLRKRIARWARAGWPVSLVARRLQGGPSPGDSVEAWARQHRYAALGAMAAERGIDLVLLAHHRRDQAETVLLQALRSAGPAGLSAMPRDRETAGVRWVRPWLEADPKAIEAYARRHRLRWVEDPSNRDPRFDRSRLRQAVWPVLADAFPQVELALARVARWQQQAAGALADLARQDLSACRPGGRGEAVEALSLAAWRALTPPRRMGVLRAWLQPPGAGYPAPGGALLERLMEELPSARTGARWWLPDGSGAVLELALARNGRLTRRTPPNPRPEAVPAVARPDRLSLAGLGRPGRHRVEAWGGALVVRAVSSGGLPVALLERAQLRPRRGGERFQMGPGRPPRALKKQFQAGDRPPWMRDGPLLWAGDRLLWVAGLGVDARSQAAEGEPQRALTWEPDAPADSRQIRAGRPR